jgi:hypothetical protein
MKNNNTEPLMVCAFSGGIASAVMSHIVNKEHPGRTVLQYHSTATEPKDNDRIRREASSFISLPIIDDSDGRDIWQVFADEGFLGNQRTAPCSRILKQERGNRWIKQNTTGGIKCLGYTIEEQARAQRAEYRALQDGYKVDFPLIRKQMRKSDCWRIVTKCWGLKPPEMYKWAEHANCVPCIKGGLAYWGMVYLHAKHAWDRAIAEEKKHNHQILGALYGSLEEEQERCIRLAKQYMAKKKQAQKHRECGFASLLETPCGCNV